MKPQTSPAIFLVAAVACLPALQYGFATGVLNVPQNEIVQQLNISASGPYWGIVVSIFCLGGLIGAQQAATIADARGRRALLGIVGIVCGLSGLVQGAAGWLAASKMPHPALATLIAGRLISGVGCGFATVATPIYLGEIASVSVRGLFGALNQLSVVIGILVAQGIAALLVNVAHVHFMWVLIMPSLLSIIQLISLALLPESPRWALSKQGREASLDCLRRLRHSAISEAELENEVDMMISDTQSSSSRNETKVGVRALLADPTLRFPLIIAVLLNIGQQFSGINGVFYFSTSFFAAAGLSNAVVGTLLASTVNVIAMAISVPLMEKAGRRKLLLFGISGMLISALGLSAVLILKNAHVQPIGILDNASVLCVLLYVAFFEFGPGSIPWTIGTEIFAEGPRATAMSLSAAVNWTCNATIGLTFLPLQNALGQYIFLPFSGVLVLWLGFVAFFVPETRGKTLAQIQSELRRQPTRSISDQGLLADYADQTSSTYVQSSDAKEAVAP